jgi:hypothetical protein
MPICKSAELLASKLENLIPQRHSLALGAHEFAFGRQSPADHRLIQSRDNLCRGLSISLKDPLRRETMPLLDQAAKWTTNKMPKVITPKAHAIIDYAMAASFFGMAAFFWRRNKRAAVSALVCGVAETVTALCTDYPGGVVKEISYETHGTIDFGLSGMVASLPDMLRFADDPESRFFRMQGLGLATVTGLTDFTGSGEGNQLEELDRRSA